MKKELRTAVCDGGLRVEAYRFEGIVQHIAADPKIQPTSSKLSSGVSERN